MSGWLKNRNGPGRASSVHRRSYKVLDRDQTANRPQRNSCSISQQEVQHQLAQTNPHHTSTMPTNTAPTIVSPASPAPVAMGGEEEPNRGTVRAALVESFGTTPPAHASPPGLIEDPFYDSLESLICEGWSSNNDVSVICAHGSNVATNGPMPWASTAR